MLSKLNLRPVTSGPGALVPVLTRYPPPVFGIFVLRPPGQHPSRKVRVLTEILIERFGDDESVSGLTRD